jgi:hypothetical protein
MALQLFVRVGRPVGGAAFQRSVPDVVAGTDQLDVVADVLRSLNDGLGLTDSVTKVLTPGGGGSQFGGNFGGTF